MESFDATLLYEPLLVCRRHDVDAATATVELDEAIDQSEKRVIAPLADVQTRVENGSHLADENVAGTNRFAAKTLDAATLGIGIAAVAAGSLTFLMSHVST